MGKYFAVVLMVSAVSRDRELIGMLGGTSGGCGIVWGEVWMIIMDARAAEPSTGWVQPKIPLASRLGA
jgi:hypothetical protein